MKRLTGYPFQATGLSRVCTGDLACRRRPKTNPMRLDLVGARWHGDLGFCTRDRRKRRVTLPDRACARLGLMGAIVSAPLRF